MLTARIRATAKAGSDMAIAVAHRVTLQTHQVKPIRFVTLEAMCSSLECRRGAPLEFAAHLSSTED